MSRGESHKAFSGRDPPADRAVNWIREWQEKLLAEYEVGRCLRFEQMADQTAVAFSQEPKQIIEPKQFIGSPLLAPVCHGLLPNVCAIVVGLDLREYSRRTPEQQLFLTVSLHASIKLAIKHLRGASLVQWPEPRIIIQTGDGAYIVFTFLDSDQRDEIRQAGNTISNIINSDRSKLEVVAHGDVNRQKLLEIYPALKGELEKVDKVLTQEEAYLPKVAGDAMSFVFTLNAILCRNNSSQRFITLGGKKEFEIFPVECRYAISYGNVLLLWDINGALNCVGKGIVTCARILSTDHGSHLLVDHALTKALERFGGLGELCGGQWKQELHLATLDDVKVKSGDFRYADVFGFYSDAFLLRSLRQLREMPAQYHIGSHDVRSLK